MKIAFPFFLVVCIATGVYAFPKKSIVERYTNSSCGPCATINNSWYNATTAGHVSSSTIAHIVYNVNWPSATDPMYLLNPVENAVRWTYYGVNAVPWIAVNGTTVATDASSYNLAVTAGNSQNTPLLLKLTAERFSNNVLNVKVKLYREAGDATVYTKTRLKIGLTERSVTFPSPLGNGERVFYAITRKMLPDAKGYGLTMPAAGDSIELNFQYVPTPEFIAAVNLDSLRVVAFVQNDATKEIYQSEMAPLTISKGINASFLPDATLGAVPMRVAFSSYAVGSDTARITAYAWDFDNDGVIDSREQSPSYTYTRLGKFSVALTVTDSRGASHKRVLPDLVQTLGKISDILVVNGIDYSNTTYIPEMQAFYSSSAVFGNHDVDVWDLFGDQGFNYSANSKIKQVHLFNSKIPMSVLKLYKRVIWVGNNYSGDNAFFDPAQVIDYVRAGGNFLLATRWSSAFFNTQLTSYCGIASISADMSISTAYSLDDSLQNMASIAANSFTHYVTLDTASKAIPIFDDDMGATTWIAGFRLHKPGEGVFIYVAGRPYRYNATASAANYNYMIDNWMVATPVAVPSETQMPESFILYQNYPNPFNPATTIAYTVPFAANVALRVTNALGQVLLQQAREGVQAGSGQFHIDASALPSGVYYYTVTAQPLNGPATVTATKKMLLLK